MNRPKPLAQYAQVVAEPKMALLVRRDLRMPPGKAAAQCCHACLGAYRLAVLDCPDAVVDWVVSEERKVALAVPDEAALLLYAARAHEMGLPHYQSVEAPTNARTVLAIGPAASAVLDALVGDLKLY